MDKLTTRGKTSEPTKPGSGHAAALSALAQKGAVMALSIKEQEFIHKRKRLAKYLPVLTWGSLALLIGYALFWYLRAPLLCNPFLLQQKIVNKQIPESTLFLMSSLVPIAFYVIFVVLMTFIVFLFGWISLERKYLQIIERIDKETVQNINQD